MCIYRLFGSCIHGQVEAEVKEGIIERVRERVYSLPALDEVVKILWFLEEIRI